ncbi:hypothetical protein [Streptomyces sp. MMBL 11-1]|uniref:hypothetical protein n=1 Tax=Streptomyces sp. MMBL 11-1 TaxID=3026420 RepID=UPI00235DE078|nr:hypothetical protein [Streptomyces sp. MMBL 11-1]
MKQTDDLLDRIDMGPAGRPFAFGLDAEPLTTRAAAELFEDMNARTVHKTDVVLPNGRPAVVRTICLVFDDLLATCVASELPADYVPQVFGSALYAADDPGHLLGTLWTYGLPAEAKAGHGEAVEEFASGRARVAA